MISSHTHFQNRLKVDEGRPISVRDVPHSYFLSRMMKLCTVHEMLRSEMVRRSP
jgi:hypothetical protein